MSLIEAFIAELELEVDGAKAYFEKCPNDRFDFRPHEKSMPLGTLAMHVVESLGWFPNMLEQDVFVFDPEQYQAPVAQNSEELVSKADEFLNIAVKSLRSIEEDDLFDIWRMEVGGNVVSELPKVAVIRSFGISHLIHHRGQLAVYLRLLDVPLPPIYGPTADGGMG